MSLHFSSILQLIDFQVLVLIMLILWKSVMKGGTASIRSTDNIFRFQTSPALRDNKSSRTQKIWTPCVLSGSSLFSKNQLNFPQATLPRFQIYVGTFLCLDFDFLQLEAILPFFLDHDRVFTVLHQLDTAWMRSASQKTPTEIRYPRNMHETTESPSESVHSLRNYLTDKLIYLGLSRKEQSFLYLFVRNIKIKEKRLI